MQLLPAKSKKKSAQEGIRKDEGIKIGNIL